MRALIRGSVMAALAISSAQAAAPATVHAHLEIVTVYLTEDYNPYAESGNLRVTQRTEGKETWRTQLRVESVGASSFAAIKRSFPTTRMDFHDVVWSSNTQNPPANLALATIGPRGPVWPVVTSKEESTWTLLDINRKRPDQPSNLQLVKTGEIRSGGNAEFSAGFRVEMMRSLPKAAGDEPDPVALIPGADPEPEAVALTPFVYNLSVAVSGFMVKSDISGISRGYDPELETWSETRLGPPTNGSGMPVFAHSTRPGVKRDGIAVQHLRRPSLPAALVEQLIAHPERISAPIRQTGVLTELEYASEEPGAPLIRRRDTRTTVSIRIESADLPDARALNPAADALTQSRKPSGTNKPDDLPPAAPLTPAADALARPKSRSGS